MQRQSLCLAVGRNQTLEGQAFHCTAFALSSDRGARIEAREGTLYVPRLVFFEKPNIIAYLIELKTMQILFILKNSRSQRQGLRRLACQSRSAVVRFPLHRHHHLAEKVQQQNKA